MFFAAAYFGLVDDDARDDRLDDLRQAATNKKACPD